MFRLLLLLTFGMFCFSTTSAQTMTLSTSNSDYVITNVFSDVDIFSIDIEIAASLAAGTYVNPTINTVTYQVMGTLTAGTPSGFTAFDLQRNITGAEFYAQGSSLSFEIAQSAVLTDGVQAAELVGGGIVLTLNAREVGTGRFHPALFELNANGTGIIQNSNNVPAMVEIGFGVEYITNVVFDPGNTTLLTGPVVAPPPPPPRRGGGGSLNVMMLAYGFVLFGLYLMTKNRGADQRAVKRVSKSVESRFRELPISETKE